MSKGSNPCVADREGAKMAIHYACLYGHWSCAQVMMESRWIVQNPDGLRPLAQVRSRSDAHLESVCESCISNVMMSLRSNKVRINDAYPVPVV